MKWNRAQAHNVKVLMPNWRRNSVAALALPVGNPAFRPQQRTHAHTYTRTRAQHTAVQKPVNKV